MKNETHAGRSVSEKFDLDWIAKATQGDIISRVQTKFSNIGTDTRADLSGQIFIALRGEQHDAHNYLEQAVEKGAHLLIVDQIPEAAKNILTKISVIKVGDTLRALQNMAHKWRLQSGFKVVGITGSNGKTTTKEFAATLLKAKYKTFHSPSSFNNHWGVPLSLLWTGKDEEFTVIEMGMNAAGEIATLCKIAEPDVALVTMVGSSHIGKLGSQQAIAKAKKEIYANSPHAIHIYNLDNEFTLEMFKETKNKGYKNKFFTFSGFDKQCDVFLRAERMDLGNLEVSGRIGGTEGHVNVPVFGRHNVHNLMAASAVALASGVEPEKIWKHLPNCRSIWGRNELYTAKSGATVLFDAYNANFESMTALVKNLFECDSEGKRVAVIGQMLELGAESPKLHEKLGELIGRTGFDVVWFMGADKGSFKRGIEGAGFKKKLYLSDSYEEPLAIELVTMLNQQDIAIIKGSRGMKLERILEAWQAKTR